MQPEMLRDELAARLGTAPPPLATREDIDTEAVRLTEALSGAIESGAVPLSKPRRDGRPAHAWWSDEISALHEDARRRERRAHRMRRAGNETAATAGLEAKVAKSRLKAVIRREKRRHEKSEFDEVTDKTLWATVKRVEGEREREKSIFKSPEAFYRPMLTGQLPAAQGEGGGGCEGGRGVLEKLRMSERGQETREMATTTKMEM